MSSTSTSEILVQGQDVHLSFQTSIYYNRGLRDRFVDLLKAPFDTWTRTQKEVKILDGIDFQIRQGDRIGILGVNGAGKTTLCRLIAGFLQPSIGSIEVTQNKRIKAIFDTTMGIQPELTGRENAELLFEFMYSHLDHQREEILRDAMEFSGLGEYLDAPFRIYSNGMQARLCLSIISAAPSDVLILDEVFEGADLNFKEKISLRVRHMMERSGAVVFVSHDPSTVEKVCNLCWVVHQGRIVFQGAPAEANLFYQNLIREVRV